MPRRSSLRGRAALLLVCVASVTTAAACGERASHADVVAVAEGRSLTGDTTSGSGGLIVAPTAVEEPSALAATTGAAAPSSAAIGGGTATGAVVVPTGAVATGGTVPTKVVTPTKGPGGSTTPPSATVTSAAPGKQDTSPVLICQLGHFTGLGGPTQGFAQPGLASWVRWTNAHGGLSGHPVSLDSKDDAMDPNKAQQIVQNCVQNEHAVAIVAAFVPATVDAIAPYLQQHKVPVVGGDAVTSTWFTNPDFFPEGNSSEGTAEGQVHIAVTAKKSALAIIYCTENVACTIGHDNVAAAAKRDNVPVKATYQVSLASPTFTSQCSSMQSAHIDAVYFALDGSSATRLSRDCNAINFHPLYISGGLAIDPVAAAKDPNLDGLTITTSIFPWMSANTQAEKDFQTAMATYAPDVQPAETAAAAWTSGQLLAKALSNLGNAARSAPITSAMVLQGLYTIKNENLSGLVMGRLNFHNGAVVTKNNCWGIAALHNGVWTAPQGDTPGCE